MSAGGAVGPMIPHLPHRTCTQWTLALKSFLASLSAHLWAQSLALTVDFFDNTLISLRILTSSVQIKTKNRKVTASWD